MLANLAMGLIAPHLRVVVILAQILDVAEQMSLGILRHRGTEMGADAPERGRRLGRCVADDGQAAALMSLMSSPRASTPFTAVFSSANSAGESW